MKQLISKIIILFILVSASSISFAQEVVELKPPLANKVFVNLMLRNGSSSDPAGKDGLTFTTANSLTDGGTKDKTAKEIQEIIYPMAVSYYASVDKEVTVFTFQVHVDFVEKFYPILRDLVLSPAFAEEDFKKVRSNQENYV